MQLPVQNIYRILCYAWNDKIFQNYKIEFASKSEENLENFCFEILKIILPKIFKSGIHKEYKNEDVYSRAIKGKLNIKESLSELYKKTSYVNINHDEYGENNITNRILKYTLVKLLKSSSLEKDQKKVIRKLLLNFNSVDTVLKINPNDINMCLTKHKRKEYRLALSICLFFCSSTLSDKSKQSHKRNSIIDALTDQLSAQESGTLFEKFIKNFLSSRLSHNISSNTLRFKSDTKTELFTDLLPTMTTDISISNEKCKLIIDAKCYNEVLRSRNGGNNKFRSDHIYQLQSYLLHEPLQESLKGLLLYCHSSEVVFEQGWVIGYPITVATIDLSSDWEVVTTSILNIVTKAFDHKYRDLEDSA